jgi:hypothetical protein
LLTDPFGLVRCRRQERDKSDEGIRSGQRCALVADEKKETDDGISSYLRARADPDVGACVLSSEVRNLLGIGYWIKVR